MKRRNQFILALLLLVLAIGFFFALRNTDKKPKRHQVPTTALVSPKLPTQATPPTVGGTLIPPSIQAEERRQAVDLVEAIYSAPIAFYGRAQDQQGQPVPGAMVEYSILDRFFEPGSKKSGIADGKGNFSLTGVQGAALTVGVSKEGYDPIYQQSNGAFSFGAPHDSQRDRPTPTKDNPAIFVLRKRAEAEALVKVRSRQYEIAKDGAPAEVNLETGKPVAAGQGHLRVECWTDVQAKDAQGRFPWKCRVSVPGGGLLERNPEHDFEAPKGSYLAADEIIMAPDDPQQRWSYSAEKQYFLKLADGRYARAKLNFYTGKRTIFVLESYLNPSGSPNLELDPAKVVNAR